MFQDEEHAKRTKNSNIVAFGEKRERESSDHEDEQHSPTKRKGHSSTQEGQHSENGNTSRTNVSSMPGRRVLEFVLDLLQRNDPEDLFAETNDLDVDDINAEQPMDFTTMRAKLHMGMYTSMEEFKLDVYLMCTNAMDAYPANTRHHIVAEAINTYAREVFEDLTSPDPVIYQLEPSLRRPPSAPGRKTQGGQPRTTEHAKFHHKPAAETENRDNWLPNDKSLFSGVSNAQPYIQYRYCVRPRPSKVSSKSDQGCYASPTKLKENDSNYKNNLCVVEDLEPNAQKVATTNLLVNVSGSQPTPQQAPPQPDGHELSLALSLSNESLKDDSDACAAAPLGNVYLHYDKRESN